jgi:hypothetical protein
LHSFLDAIIPFDPIMIRFVKTLPIICFPMINDDAIIDLAMEDTNKRFAFLPDNMEIGM